MNKVIYSARLVAPCLNRAIKRYYRSVMSVVALLVITAMTYGQYCLPTYQTASCTSGDYISGVQFNAINNLGIACPGPSGNYIDFTASNCTNVCPGSAYQVAIYNNATNGEYMAVCIDLNGDGLFSDPGDFFPIGYAAPGATITANIVIPMSVTPGNSRFRVFCQGGTTPLTQNDVCGNLQTGEVQDYCLIINPPVSLSLGTGIAQCGGTIPLDAGNAGSFYTWSDGSSNETLIVSTSGNYSVTVTDTNGCSATSSVNVYIKPVPAVYLGENITQCGGTATLNAGNPGQSYLWSDGETTQTIQVDSSDTYTVTVTSVSNGCFAFDSIEVTIDSMPLVTLNAPAPQCGGFDTLDAGNAGSNYLWSDGSTNETLIVSSSAIYRVTVTGTNGCSTSSSVNIHINPVPVVYLGGNITQCGGTATLNAGNPGQNFMWTDGETTQTIQVDSSDLYAVTVTNASNGCFAYDSIEVIIDSVPVITLNAFAAQCGGFDTLDAGNPGSSYLWSNGSTNETLIVSNSAIYRVTVTDLNNCTASATENVTIRSLPAVTLNIQANVCNTIPNFILYGGAPAGGIYYVDYAPDTAINTIDEAILQHHVSYVYTDTNNCSDSASTTVVVRKHPFITTLDPPTMCTGSSPINLDNYFTPTGGVYSGLGVSTHYFYPPLTAAGNDTIIDIVTDTYGCIDTSIYPLTISQSVKVALSPNPLDNSICAGQAVSFSAFGATQYQYFINGIAQGNMSTTSTYSTFALQNGDMVTVVGTNACSADTSIPVGFDVHPLPVVSAGNDTSMALGQSIQLNGVASGSGLLVYQWSPASVLNIGNIPDPVYSGTADSVVFTLVVSDTYGCIDSSHVTVRVFVPNAIVLPNVITPDGNGKNDTWKINPRVDLAGSKLVIFNRWGETVYEAESYNNDWGGTYKGTGEKLPDGTYYYELQVPSENNHLYKGAISILNSGAGK